MPSFLAFASIAITVEDCCHVRKPERRHTHHDLQNHCCKGSAIALAAHTFFASLRAVTAVNYSDARKVFFSKSVDLGSMTARRRRGHGIASTLHKGARFRPIRLVLGHRGTASHCRSRSSPGGIVPVGLQHCLLKEAEKMIFLQRLTVTRPQTAQRRVTVDPTNHTFLDCQ